MLSAVSLAVVVPLAVVPSAAGPGGGAAARPLLHELHQVPAVRLDGLGHAGVRDAQRHENLHDELVAGRRAQVGRGAQPGVELDGPVRRDPVGLLRAFALPVGLDEAVALWRTPYSLTWENSTVFAVLY